ncbi:MAG: hypothetical protein CM15mP51_22630 [Porticoccaceae bacterium]|nr:MAG: hypothetical protein CM15mP51_22630 [Porticoccaceae bacterium]
MAMLSTLSTLLPMLSHRYLNFIFFERMKPAPQKQEQFSEHIGFLLFYFCNLGAGVEIVAYSFLLILLGSPIFVMSKK